MNIEVKPVWPELLRTRVKQREWSPVRIKSPPHSKTKQGVLCKEK